VTDLTTGESRSAFERRHTRFSAVTSPSEILSMLMGELLYLALLPIMSLLNVRSPVGMALERLARISGSPPVNVVPISSGEVTLPIGMVLGDPIGSVLMPPGVVMPEVVLVEVAPPFGMI
jgi:hypothetical protein